MRVIDGSWHAPEIAIQRGFGGTVRIEVKSGRQIADYGEVHIVSISEIDSKTYRSAGAAAAGV